MLVPITASGRAAASMLRSTGPLISGCSSTASSIRSASATASGRLSAARRLARTRSADPGSNRPCSSKSAASRRSRSRWRRVRAGSASTITTSKPGHGEDLGDTATHVAGPDDGDVFDLLSHAEHDLPWVNSRCYELHWERWIGIGDPESAGRRR